MYSPCAEAEGTAPYLLVTRKERSRGMAQKRRTTHKTLMDELAGQLPLSRDVVGQMDYNSRLRVALCFLQMKTFMSSKRGKRGDVMETRREESTEIKLLEEVSMTEALDGFMIVISLDGTIIYIAENVHKYLGLFHSEHIGGSLYDLVEDSDHEELKNNLIKIEAEAACPKPDECDPITFFCRMKCLRSKVTSNAARSSSGYKLMFISGRPSTAGNDHLFVAVVRPVTPPSILEVRTEYNVFVTHYSLDLKCIFFDGRLQQLHGYSKGDLIGRAAFEFHHHDDLEVTLKCSHLLMTKGEGISGYYRYLTHHGNFIWMQSRATLMYDSRSGDPSHIVCVNFIINDIEEPQLTLRDAIRGTAGLSYVHHPFPLVRDDGKTFNPFSDEGTEGNCVSPKGQESPLENPLSCGRSLLSSSSPSFTAQHSSSFSTHPEDLSSHGIFPEPVDPVLIKSNGLSSLSLSPLSDSGYSSMSLRINQAQSFSHSSADSSPSPMSQHSDRQGPQALLDTITPYPSPPSSCTTNAMPQSTLPYTTPSSCHQSLAVPSPPLELSPLQVHSPTCTSSPDEVIGNLEDTVANYGQTVTPSNLLSCSPIVEDMMDITQLYLSPQCGGRWGGDMGTDCNQERWYNDAASFPILTQDDLDMLLLAEAL